jgi:hypothetical protein
MTPLFFDDGEWAARDAAVTCKLPGCVSYFFAGSELTQRIVLG